MTDQYEVQRILDRLNRADNMTQDLNRMADHSRRIMQVSFCKSGSIPV